MAMFVHLAPEKYAKKIRRSGMSELTRSRVHPTGIYATPLVRNFFLSHQWLRELTRGGAGPMVGIYFRLPNDQVVWVAHYAKPHQRMTAAQTVALLQSRGAADPYPALSQRERVYRASCRCFRPPRQGNPSGRMVAGFFPAAGFAVDAG